MSNNNKQQIFTIGKAADIIYPGETVLYRPDLKQVMPLRVMFRTIQRNSIKKTLLDQVISEQFNKVVDLKKNITKNNKPTISDKIKSMFFKN